MGHLSAQDNERIFVVTSNESLASVVKEVGGEYVEVRNITPPGVDPHLYEPSIQELLSLISNASLILLTGPHHYPVEEKIKQLSSEGLINALILDYKNYQKEGLKILEIDGAPNPHGYFFSLNGLKAIAKACTAELSRLMPDRSKYFEQRLNAYLDRLALIEDVTKHINVAGVKVVLADPVLQYVAHDLGLEVEGVLIHDHSVEPSPGEIIRVVRLVHEGEITLVLLSDMGAESGSAIMATLKENNVPYALIPLLDFSDVPEVAPVYTASIVKSRAQPRMDVRSWGGMAEPLLVPSLAANAILGLSLLLLVIKVRGRGRDRAQKRLILVWR